MTIKPLRIAGALLAGALAIAPALPAAAQAADAANLPGIAVMDFNGFMLGDGGNSYPLGKAVASMMVTEFASRPNMRVVERQQMQAILREQNLALSGRVDESTAVEIGKILGMNYIMLGSATSIGGTLRLDIRAIDVETTESIDEQKLVGTPEELLDMLVRIVDTFADRLELVAPGDRPEPEPIPAQATIQFSRGVAAEDEGEVAAALDFYRQALEIHPTHVAAQRAVKRLEEGGEVS